MMMRAFASVMVGLAAMMWAVPAHAAARPNVILVLVDDAGYGDLSCHGNPVLKTPNLDRLHGESVRLAQFHVSPMCTPTRGQLLTGVDALRNGAMNVSSGRTLLRREFPTLADAFASSGYRTGIFGKWHLGDNYPYRPQDRGFQTALWFPSSHIPSAPDHWKNDYFDPWLRNEAGRVKQFKGYCTDVYFDEAMRWMGERKQAREPFFCYLPLNAAHGPLFVPDRYRAPYRDQKPNVASFFGMIANIDENMGRLEKMLVEQGLRDNTLLIYMTDNGGTAGVPVYNAGMRGRKIDLWDGGHRVPCFIRWPGGGLGGSPSAARDIGELTQAQDLSPTLIDLCGLQTPANARFDGVSLAGIFRGTQPALLDRMLVVQFSRMNRPQPQRGDAAVLWKNWRLIGERELYDIAADPAQKLNVIDQHVEVAAKMRQHYAQWWEGVAPRLNEFSPIIIGSDRENPAMLSPAEWADSFLDQSAQVRAGLNRNGQWHVEVERDGNYEFSLRRWPVESDLPLRAGVAAWRGGDGEFSAGKALPIAAAKLRVGAEELHRRVGERDKAAVFTIPLVKGRTTVQTWFYDERGEELCGAYYVYVTRKR